ncbi:MAG: prephenate dehydrogenase/arogenate dehydrogenase family protein, partial [Lachnospiraceae bacterium]|nr:prephenate dehydrogenase/arogenate dehydrogenase family protein [Lachnospiraceae bacterium]
YVEIPDEPGALATIVSLIAFQRISIKNIGITHNREIATGSLRLELYEENEVEHAATVLREKNYLVTIPEM